MRDRRLGRIVAAALFVALLAWSSSVVGSVSARRSISVLCSSIESVCREWAAGFTRHTGIEVSLVRMSTGEAYARLARPGAAADFDVWHGGPADTYELAKRTGLLAPYRPAGAAAIPARYRDPDGYWTGVYVGVLGFCSNTDVLRRLGVPTPRSWDDLLDPRLAGQLSVPNARTSGTGYTLVWANRVRLGSDAATIDYLRRLDDNVLQYTSSGIAPALVAARGEAAVALTFSQHCVQARDAGYESLEVTYPAEGTGAEIGSVAILAGTRDADAARRYVDFAVSEQAQRMGAQLPTREDLASDARLGAGAPRLVYTAAEAAAAKVALTDAVTAEVYR